ncbi:helix-turn-helix domain-containing protein [Candidatus Woesearchaeota archaeon]|nr:helix-turn-helix domain-containing protein [Candidatus Woesearchaeota archaeon]
MSSLEGLVEGGIELKDELSTTTKVDEAIDPVTRAKLQLLGSFVEHVPEQLYSGIEPSLENFDFLFREVLKKENTPLAGKLKLLYYLVTNVHPRMYCGIPPLVEEFDVLFGDKSKQLELAARKIAQKYGLDKRDMQRLKLALSPRCFEVLNQNISSKYGVKILGITKGHWHELVHALKAAGLYARKRRTLEQVLLILGYLFPLDTNNRDIKEALKDTEFRNVIAGRIAQLRYMPKYCHKVLPAALKPEYLEVIFHHDGHTAENLGITLNRFRQLLSVLNRAGLLYDWVPVDELKQEVLDTVYPNAGLTHRDYNRIFFNSRLFIPVSKAIATENSLSKGLMYHLTRAIRNYSVIADPELTLEEKIARTSFSRQAIQNSISVLRRVGLYPPDKQLELEKELKMLRATAVALSVDGVAPPRRVFEEQFPESRLLKHFPSYNVAMREFGLEVRQTRYRKVDTYSKFYHLLSEAPLYFKELVTKSGLGETTVCSAIKTLCSKGLLKRNRKENRVYYSLNKEGIEARVLELLNGESPVTLHTMQNALPFNFKTLSEITLGVLKQPLLDFILALASTTETTIGEAYRRRGINPRKAVMLLKHIKSINLLNESGEYLLRCLEGATHRLVDDVIKSVASCSPNREVFGNGSEHYSVLIGKMLPHVVHRTRIPTAEVSALSGVPEEVLLSVFSKREDGKRPKWAPRLKQQECLFTCYKGQGGYVLVFHLERVYQTIDAALGISAETPNEEIKPPQLMDPVEALVERFRLLEGDARWLFKMYAPYALKIKAITEEYNRRENSELEAWRVIREIADMVTFTLDEGVTSVTARNLFDFLYWLNSYAPLPEYRLTVKEGLMVYKRYIGDVRLDVLEKQFRHYLEQGKIDWYDTSQLPLESLVLNLNNGNSQEVKRLFGLNQGSLAWMLTDPYQQAFEKLNQAFEAHKDGFKTPQEMFVRIANECCSFTEIQHRLNQLSPEASFTSDDVFRLMLANPMPNSRVYNGLIEIAKKTATMVNLGYMKVYDGDTTPIGMACNYLARGTPPQELAEKIGVSRAQIEECIGTQF